MAARADVAVTRVLGVDLGARRIGLAVSDPSGTLASPLTVLERSGDERADRAAILDAARDAGATRVVVGLPRSLSGATGPAAAHAQAEIDALARQAGDAVTVEAHDERFTTVTATRRIREGASRREPVSVDAAAAAEILQSYLDALAIARGRGRGGVR